MKPPTNGDANTPVKPITVITYLAASGRAAVNRGASEHAAGKRGRSMSQSCRSRGHGRGHGRGGQQQLPSKHQQQHISSSGRGAGLEAGPRTRPPSRPPRTSAASPPPPHNPR